MKIGDLWVKLGLKKDEFSKGIKDADGDVKGFAGRMKSMSGVAKASWGAVAAAVVKFATDAVKMTQRWGDAWNNTMEGIKGAYSAFVRQLSSGAGWDNLFSNMREAYRVSKEVAAALDEIFERKTSFSYQEAQTQKEIAEWQLILRDSSKSDAERKRAAEEIIAAEERLANVRRGIYQDEAKARRDQFKIQTGISNDKDIDFLVKEYNLNRDIINEGRKYLKERKEAQKEKTWLTIAGSLDESPGGSQLTLQARDAAQAIKDLDDATSQAVKDVAALLKKYDSGNDELVKNMAEAEVAVIRVDTEMMHAQTRATAMLGSLKKAGTGSGQTSDPNQAKAESILKRAEDSAKTELQILSEKYDAEKALLQQYGLDTNALWDEYTRNLKKIIDTNLSDLSVDIDLGLEDIDMSEADAEIQKFISNLESEMERAQEFVEELRDSVIGGFSSAVQELANQFMGMEEINPGRVVQALLTPLADMAVKAGEVILAEGVAVEAAKTALTSFQGIGAIAAGGLLIAAGAAAKAGLSALASTGGRSTSATTYGAGTGSTGTQDLKTEMTVYVKGTIRGSDIVLSGQKTVNNWNR